MLQVLEGPTPVTVKLYRQEGGAVVESGDTATVTQYRYGSSDPNTWNRLVVWVLERDGMTTLAEIGYPEFPRTHSCPNPPIRETISSTTSGSSTRNDRPTQEPIEPGNHATIDTRTHGTALPTG